MMTTFELSWIVIILIAALSALLAYLFTRQHFQALMQKHATERQKLITQLEVEQAQTKEKIQALNESREQLKESFTALSKSVLDAKSDSFVQLAQQKLGLFESRAQANLTEKEKSIENLLKPVNAALEKTEKQLSSIEKERKEAYGSITTQLQMVTEAQQGLQSETEQLVRALRRP